MFARVRVFISLECIPRSEIAGLCGNSVSSFSRDCHTIFQSGHKRLVLLFCFSFIVTWCGCRTPLVIVLVYLCCIFLPLDDPMDGGREGSVWGAWFCSSVAPSSIHRLMGNFFKKSHLFFFLPRY